MLYYRAKEYFAKKYPGRRVMALYKFNDYYYYQDILTNEGYFGKDKTKIKILPDDVVVVDMDNKLKNDQIRVKNLNESKDKILKQIINGTK